MVRPSRLADVAALHALVESAYRGESAKAGWTHEADLLGGQRTDPAALIEMINDPTQTILLAESDAGAIGCVLVADKGMRDGEHMAYLGLLTVRPDLQSAGLGRTLIDAAETHARGFGATTMEMTVIRQRSELIAWYLRRGYKHTGRTAPSPWTDPRYGLPKTDDLELIVLAKSL